MSVTFDSGKQLSKCVLWDVERDYFKNQGITAWLHDVPYYVTSNPFIAKTYSKVVIHFIRDWIAKHPEAKQHPFYVMELGTGPGRFSYYMVKILDELRRDFGMDDVKIVFVMTDFAQANLDYHMSHHALLPYVEKGLLDFAIHDMMENVPVKLVHSKVELNQKTLVNPLTLFANYVFDTIPNDAFSARNGKLSELLVTLSTDESNMKNQRPVNLEEVTVDYTANEIHGAYYQDPAIDGVLELYKNSLKDSSFLLPIGSIRGLSYLNQLANGRIMLISSDKAYSELSALEGLDHPALTAHGGCFSMMVNCHAIGQYFKNIGGDFFTQSMRTGLKTCFYTTGIRLDELPETRVALKEYIEKFSPTDFFNVYRHFNETAEQGELSGIASYLQLTEWDPHAYMRISKSVLSHLNEANFDTLNFLINNMHKLGENYYYMPKTDCILFEIGVFFHTINDYAKALEYYRQAVKFIGEEFRIKYNTALCLHHLDKSAEALDYFKQALKLSPDSEEAKSWIEYLQKEHVHDHSKYDHGECC
jgi:tetratricopeptide (TPR) repeat protein